MANSKCNSNKKEIAEQEYDRAISLMQYQTDLLWVEFGAFLLAETVLIGFLGNALTQEGSNYRENLLVFGGAILGLILCIPWWSTFRHNYEYYILRIEQAKRHETALGIALLTEGEELSSGRKLDINGKTLRHPWLVRRLPPRCAVPGLILIFGAAFTLLAIITGPWCN